MTVIYLVSPRSKLPIAICGMIFVVAPMLAGAAAVPGPARPVCPSTKNSELSPLLHSAALYTKIANATVTAAASAHVFKILCLQFIKSPCRTSADSGNPFRPTLSHHCARYTFLLRQTERGIDYAENVRWKHTSCVLRCRAAGV